MKIKDKKKFISSMVKMILLILFISCIYIYQKLGGFGIIFFDDVEEINAYVTEYTVYGTHLNITGTLNIETDEISNACFVLRTLKKEEKSFDLNYTLSTNQINFNLSDLINEGIDLEKLDINDYYAFIKIQYNDESIKYYSLKNDTEYSDIEYYTITKNDSNNKINIEFNTHENVEYMSLNVQKTTLPNDVYDIVIDPGHGGADVGATYGSYYEADIALSVAQELKEELESLGLKIKITRDGTEDNSFNVYSVYDEDGRVNIVRKL